MASQLRVAALLAVVPVAFEVLLTYFPFALSLASFDGIHIVDLLREIVASKVGEHGLYQSVLQGSLSAAAAFAIGYPVGLSLGLYRFTGKTVYRTLTLLPFMLPSIVVVVGFQNAYPARSVLGFLSNGLSGIVAVNTFYNAPLIAMLTAASISNLKSETLWALETIRPPGLRTLTRVLAPASLRAAGTGAVIAFIYSYLAFLVPLAVGGPRYYTSEVEVYVLLKTLSEPSLAVSLALAQSFIPAILAIAILSMGSASFAPGFSDNAVKSLSKLSAAPKIAVSLILILFLAFEAAPLAAIVYSSGALSTAQTGFKELLEASARGQLQVGLGRIATNSLVYSVLATSITVALSLVLAHHGLSGAGGKLVYQYAAFFPLAISPVTIGLSLYLAYGSQPIFKEIWPMIVLAQSAVSIPLASRFMIEGVSRVGKELVWAAKLSGAGLGDTLFRVEIPSAASSLAAAAAVAFEVSLGEFAATTTVYTPSYTTLPLAVYTMFDLRLQHAASALSLILLVIAAIANYTVIRGAGLLGGKS
ncbi:MAG: ABC transporter permease subunit [Thermoprotei archaeon]